MFYNLNFTLAGIEVWLKLESGMMFDFGMSNVVSSGYDAYSFIPYITGWLCVEHVENVMKCLYTLLNKLHCCDCVVVVVVVVELL